MKPSERNGMKDADLKSFLKWAADPQIAQILGDDPSQHINRGQARKMGEQNADKVYDKVMEKRKELQEFREFTLGKWLHGQMKEHFSDWLMKKAIDNSKIPHMLGWYWGSEHKPQFAAMEGQMPKMYPSSRIFLARRKPRFWVPYITENRLHFNFWGPLIIKSQQIFHWAESEDK